MDDSSYRHENLNSSDKFQLFIPLASPTRVDTSLVEGVKIMIDEWVAEGVKLFDNGSHSVLLLFWIAGNPQHECNG